MHLLSNKNRFVFLRETFRKYDSNLSNLSYSFDSVINALKWELKSYRCNLILDAIKRMVKENAFKTSDRINEIFDLFFNSMSSTVVLVESTTLDLNTLNDQATISVNPQS